MRTLLIGVLAATLVGCSYPLSPQASMEACADPNGFGGLNKMAGSRPVEPAPVSSRNRAATAKVKSAAAAKTEERSTAAVRDKPQLAEKKAASTVIEAKVEVSRSKSACRDARSSPCQGEDHDCREIGGPGGCRVR